MRYRFGDFELQTEAYTLTRAGRSLRLRPKVFDVLRFLIENPDRVLTKNQLHESLWDAVHVNEAVVPWSISRARRALGQKAHQKQPIETVHGRGYRWRADVAVSEEPVVATLRAPNAPPDLCLERPAPEALADVVVPDHSLPFVGRAALMESLRQRLVQARRGNGGLCMLLGEAGIGKTRCMDELAAVARSSGFTVWSGRAIEGRGAPAFWPWTQVLRCAASGQQSVRDRSRAMLARLNAGPTRRPASADSESLSGRFMLIDAVAQFLLDFARRRPLLLLLDDLHWADAASVELLASLAPDLRNHAVLAVASQRDQLADSHAQQHARLMRHVERIDVPLLGAEDIEEYIQRVTRLPSFEPDFCSALHRVTAGNALFLQETVRTLIAQYGRAGLSSLSGADVTPAPLVRDVLGERLDILDGRVRDVLSSASVLGERFDLDLLQRVSRLDVDGLLCALEVAARAGLVVAEGSQGYRFCYGLVRSVLYEALTAQARNLTHRAAAVAIAKMSEAIPRHGELARHYHCSLALGDAAVAAQASRRAAEEAARSGELEDAAMFCAWALESQALDVDATPCQRTELLSLKARLDEGGGWASSH